jgi:hypothetical protein
MVAQWWVLNGTANNNSCSGRCWQSTSRWQQRGMCWEQGNWRWQRWDRGSRKEGENMCSWQVGPCPSQHNIHMCCQVITYMWGNPVRFAVKSWLTKFLPDVWFLAPKVVCISEFFDNRHQLVTLAPIVAVKCNLLNIFGTLLLPLVSNRLTLPMTSEQDNLRTLSSYWNKLELAKD